MSTSFLVEQFYSQIWTAGDLEATAAILADDFCFRVLSEPSSKDARRSKDTSAMFVALFRTTGATFSNVSARAIGRSPRCVSLADTLVTSAATHRRAGRLIGWVQPYSDSRVSGSRTYGCSAIS